jgi:hypothetical protein
MTNGRAACGHGNAACLPVGAVSLETRHAGAARRARCGAVAGIGLALAALMAALPARAELRVSAGAPIAIAVDDRDLNLQPQRACDAAGNCVVAWDRFGFSTSPVGILARRYDALGNPHGGVFSVSTQPSDGGFFVGYDSTRCDVRGCLGRSPTGAYAVRFAVQP